jgi:hypothetical protein
VPDYVRDWIEVARRSGKSGLRKDRLVKQMKKMQRKWKEMGVDPSQYTQDVFCRVLADATKQAADKGLVPADKPETDFREWMFKFAAARLIREDFSDWTGWEFRNKWAEGSYSPELPNRRWRLESAGSIAILGEQGLGDEVMFASCIPEVQVRIPKVVLECDPRLEAVMRRSLRIETRPRQDIVDRGESIVKYMTIKRAEEVFIPIGDLPRLFRKAKSHFPRKAYLNPLPEYVEKWAHLKGRTGVAWRSRTGQVLPADFRVENAVALQYDIWAYEREGLTVPDCDLRNDIEDLLGICSNLERIVSVPQTIVHLAGSIGAKVDVVMPPVGSSRVENQLPYRYVPGPMLWYPNVTVYQNLAAYRHR